MRDHHEERRGRELRRVVESNSDRVLELEERVRLIEQALVALSNNNGTVTTEFVELVEQLQNKESKKRMSHIL